MKTSNELKETVRRKYAEIALQSKEVNETSCCGSGCCSDEVSNIMNESYEMLEGYQQEADLGLGCGLPTQFAKIKKGDTVIDLGSGAGNDCFVARAEAGSEGKVIGIDFTPEMVSKARENASAIGYDNVEFILGDIENMPVENDTADVVVSNCVLNLVPDKRAVFHEIFRVLKPGGHFSISDVVLIGDLPGSLKEDAEMYAGCVSGAVQKSEYMGLIEDSGFRNITVQKERAVYIPDDILLKYLKQEDLDFFRNGRTGIFSITVYAEKP
ncbi:MAG: arsenite methyltransferase [Ignavibacteria bacterium]|nr:arsenite methyltransferase [Ignavibacteria bacterium]